MAFSETKFPGVDAADYVTPPHNHYDSTIENWLLPCTDLRGSSLTPPIVDTGSSSTEPAATTEPADTPEPPATTQSVPAVTYVSEPMSPRSSPTSNAPALDVIETSSPGIPEVLLRRGHHLKTPSVLLKEYVTSSAQVHNNNRPSPAFTSSDPGPQRTVSGIIPYPISSYLSDDLFSEKHRAFMASIFNDDAPRSYKEAVKHKVWCDSMSNEIEAFEINHTWDITTLPPGKKALGNQRIYTNKYNADGTLDRRKSRLVVCGNNQIEGEDFNETFPPVAKLSTV